MCLLFLSRCCCTGCRSAVQFQTPCSSFPKCPHRGSGLAAVQLMHAGQLPPSWVAVCFWPPTTHFCNFAALCGFFLFSPPSTLCCRKRNPGLCWGLVSRPPVVWVGVTLQPTCSSGTHPRSHDHGFSALTVPQFSILLSGLGEHLEDVYIVG